MKGEIKFIEYNGIEGYIELMKHDIEPLNDPEVKNIELCYSGKDIKAVLDYITNLQEENENLKDYLKIMEKGKDNNLNRFLDYKSRNEKAREYIKENCIDDEFYINLTNKEKNIIEVLNILGGDDNE